MDLSHWDLESVFSTHQAACLAVGVDPNIKSTSEADEAKIKLIKEKLTEAIRHAESLVSFWSPWESFDDAFMGSLDNGKAIISIELSKYIKDYDSAQKIDYDRLNSMVDYFSRESLDKWFNARKFKPIYDFLLGQKSITSKSVEEKALSTTERSSLLTIIAALCDCSAIDINQRGAAKRIEEITEEFGYRVSNDTISRVIKQIPEVLEARSK